MLRKPDPALWYNDNGKEVDPQESALEESRWQQQLKSFEQLLTERERRLEQDEAIYHFNYLATVVAKYLSTSLQDKLRMAASAEGSSETPTLKDLKSFELPPIKDERYRRPLSETDRAFDQNAIDALEDMSKCARIAGFPIETVLNVYRKLRDAAKKNGDMELANWISKKMNYITQSWGKPWMVHNWAEYGVDESDGEDTLTIRDPFDLPS